ncbi:hypothetical protein TTHERM_00887990 (macronuclear) [Tetrahymena thermophila SB210]|uniref:Uncharacterized protein n=1 Tax=Tetrahymena thermophila (strain SB210) TaxID=312017 RepID=Q23UA1_TETTS|nr:hypothetical protein TTHERM_00887990 [Tetrahymena thermophila SB210]EAS00043.2 hypothetical protein TTHERM_00887990 [Tetrahymena thermophila SB210]|eukprot:XP_001020288.2 hypothetical protein TTHERM_00887990 [Tetrahymena thermophila SB210]
MIYHFKEITDKQTFQDFGLDIVNSSLLGYSSVIDKHITKNLLPEQYQIQQKAMKITDFQPTRNIYQEHNKIFHDWFMQNASYLLHEETGKYFHVEYYQKVLNCIITQVPFQTLTLDSEHAKDLMNNDLIKQQTKRFQQLVNRNLVHIASCNYGVQDSIGYIINFNVEQIPIESQLRKKLNFCVQLKRIQLQLKNQVQQMAIYVQQQNLAKLRNFKNFEFYLAIAIIEKFFIVPDFFGVPLHDYEFQNYRQAMIQLQKSYIRKFNHNRQSEHEPYKSNLKIQVESYRKAQFQQLCLLNDKLNNL